MTKIFRILLASLYLSISLTTYTLANFSTENEGMNLCEKAINDVSRNSEVSEKVLLNIAKIETGRTIDGQVRPWPWTVHFNGTGYWFDSRETALYFVYEKIRSGASNIDLGCFQINYKWHGHNFESIFHIFDPAVNTSYAAAFLSDLYRETRDWRTAIGAFHSKTFSFAQMYIERYEAMSQREVKRGPDAFPLPSRPIQASGNISESGAGRPKTIASLVIVESLAKASPIYLMPQARD